MYVCARFHEIPAKGLQDIKETKCYGRDGRTDNVKTVYPPLKLRFSGGYNEGAGVNNTFFFSQTLKGSLLPNQKWNMVEF